jgi:hypothetical protein
VGKVQISNVTLSHRFLPSLGLYPEVQDLRVGIFYPKVHKLILPTSMNLLDTEAKLIHA